MALKLKKTKKKVEKEAKLPVIMAVDASMNGTAIWICDAHFKPIDWFLFTTKKFIADSSPGHTHRVQQKGFERRLKARAEFNRLVFKHRPDYIVFEQYALGRRNSSGRVFDMAEFTGDLKLAAYEYCKASSAKIRLIVNSSIKMWATGNGSADKEWMIEAAKGKSQTAGLSLIFFKAYYLSLPSVVQDVDDIADAYCIANMFIHELKLRDGALTEQEFLDMCKVERCSLHAAAFFPKKSKKKPRTKPHEMPWPI